MSIKKSLFLSFSFFPLGKKPDVATTRLLTKVTRFFSPFFFRVFFFYRKGLSVTSKRVQIRSPPQHREAAGKGRKRIQPFFSAAAFNCLLFPIFILFFFPPWKMGKKSCKMRACTWRHKAMPSFEGKKMLILPLSFYLLRKKNQAKFEKVTFISLITGPVIIFVCGAWTNVTSTCY